MNQEDFLKLLREHPLPGESAHMEFSPMRGKSSELLQQATDYKESAVAIILYQDEFEKLYTVVTERQTYNGTHSGQISFPGGKKENEDSDLVETALRECFEEIGTCLSKEYHVRTLTPVYIPVSKFKIAPELFLLPEKPSGFVAQEREVARIHEVNLNELFLPSSKTLRTVTIDNNLRLPNIPHFSQNDVHIWGATALILNELKSLLKI